MKRIFSVIVFVCLSAFAFAQNQTTVSGANVTDLNQRLLAAGQICFLGTDQSDNPISFQQGGGGQVLRRAFCSAVTTGIITSFTVPNPAATLPSGIYYRVTVKDTSSGLEVLRYTGVTFAGGTFNFDTYTPVLSGASFAPLTGTTVSGNLGVTGNVAATGSVTGSNIPGSIPGVGSCTNQFVTALNTAAPPTCANSLGGGLTTAAYNASTHQERRVSIQNPDFEGSSIIPPPGWATTAAATASYETVSPAPNKLQSLKLSTTAQFGAIRPVTNFSAVPGETYTLTAAAKSDGTGAAVIGVFCFNSANGSTGQILSSSTTSTSWSTLSVAVTVPASTDYCRVVGENTAVTQPSAVWFDQFDIRPSSFTGIVKGPEAAAPSGLANFDLLYADSTAHRWKMINNNGTAAQVVASGADINTSDQVTVTHLAAALPVAQGGTGVTAAQGNGTKNQLSTGTTTTNDFVSFDANGNTIDSAKAVPTGAVVGTTDTQTLTNKTLGGAGATTPNTQFNRLIANQGSALVAGDFSISAAWGSTASIASVTGSDAAGSITVLTGGTGIAANPSIVLTFHNGTWTNAPTCVVSRGDVQTAGHVAATTITATAVTFIVNTTPNTGQNYPLYFICVGH